MPGRPASASSPFPAAEGERRRWSDLDPELRARLERHLGAQVLHEQSEPGGFSPGVASRLTLSDGRRVFAKVVGERANPHSPSFHRREAKILAQLPPGLPVPKLISVYDDGAWVALFLEQIDGHSPRLPWHAHDLDRVLRALEQLAERLTPAPFTTWSFGEQHREVLTEWQRLAGREWPSDPGSLGSEPWIADHLGALVDLEKRLDAASHGETLLHSDLRADNILLSDHEVYFADWPGACIGAGWVDLVCFLPSVAMQGGPPPWTVFDASPLAQRAAAGDVDAVLAAITGFFVGNSAQPPPPGLSTLRPFQRAQGEQALKWLRHRLDPR